MFISNFFSLEQKHRGSFDNSGRIERKIFYLVVHKTFTYAIDLDEQTHTEIV
jgi:hypothetical protein